jgi:hypothetical protein
MKAAWATRKSSEPKALGVPPPVPVDHIERDREYRELEKRWLAEKTKADLLRLMIMEALHRNDF